MPNLANKTTGNIANRNYANGSFNYQLARPFVGGELVVPSKPFLSKKTTILSCLLLLFNAVWNFFDNDVINNTTTTKTTPFTVHTTRFTVPTTPFTVHTTPFTEHTTPTSFHSLTSTSSSGTETHFFKYKNTLGLNFLNDYYYFTSQSISM
jgi:hypothetical protein